MLREGERFVRGHPASGRQSWGLTSGPLTPKPVLFPLCSKCPSRWLLPSERASLSKGSGAGGLWGHPGLPNMDSPLSSPPSSQCYVSGEHHSPFTLKDHELGGACPPPHSHLKIENWEGILLNPKDLWVNGVISGTNR